MDYSRLKMNELKEKCKSMNLKMTGKREELTNRIKKLTFLESLNIFEDSDNSHIFTSYKKSSTNSISSSIKIQCEKSGICKTFNSIPLENNKKFFLLWDVKKKKFVKKMSFQKKIFDFTREDIIILKLINLPYEIPTILSGETLCYRNPVDEMSDDENEIYCDFE